MVPGKRNVSYEERLGLSSLERRRLRGDWIGIMRGLDRVNEEKLFPLVKELEMRGTLFVTSSYCENPLVATFRRLFGLHRGRI